MWRLISKVKHIIRSRTHHKNIRVLGRRITAFRPSMAAMRMGIASSRYIMPATVLLRQNLRSKAGDCETLILTLKDAIQGLQVELSYTIWADHGVLSRSVRFENLSEQDIELQHVFSSAVGLPADDYEIQHFHGTWAREFNEERIAVPQGRFVADSARGTSSTAHHAYVAVLQKGATESFGRCYGTTLVYSGNFATACLFG